MKDNKDDAMRPRLVSRGRIALCTIEHLVGRSILWDGNGWRLLAFRVGDQPDVVGPHTHGKPFLHLAELVGAKPGLRRQSYQDGGIAHDGCGVGRRRRGQCHAHLPYGGEQGLHLLRHGRGHVLIARVLVELLLRGSGLGGLGAEHCLVVVARGAYVAKLAVEHHHGVGL